jgi:hypothetical protein
MKAINYKTIATLSLLVFVFILGFSFSVQAYRISQQELNSPVSQYLRENYGVNSIEEYQAKLEQEIWLNYSRQMEALASEYPELNFSQWRSPDLYRQYGTSSYQPPKITPQQPFYTVIFSEPVTALQIFSLSGLGLIGLATVPPIRKSKRLKQALIIGIVVLCIFSVGYFTGYVVAQTGLVAIEPASLSGDYSYLIETDGTYVWAKSGKTGEVVYGGQWNAGGVSGTNATAVIQSAINALTPNRTWKETIALKGDLGFVHDVEISSYVRFVGFNAKLTLPSGYSAIFKQPRSDIYDVAFENINFVGTGSGVALDIFHYESGMWQNAYDVRVKDCTFDNFTTCIETIATRFWLENSKFTNFSSYGLSFLGGGGLYIARNYMKPKSDIANATDIYIGDSGEAIIDSNILWGSSASYDQTLIQIEPTACYIVISNNRLHNVAVSAIKIGTSSRTGDLYAIAIIGNHFTSMGWSGSWDTAIQVGTNNVNNYCNELLIVGNLFYGCNKMLYAGKSGINVPNKIFAYANRFKGRYGFALIGNNYYVELKDNSFELTDSPIVGTGTLIAKNNKGFVTENSGTATFSGTGSQTQFTIPHGLAGTPKVAVVTAGSNDAKGDFYVTYDATNIYVTYATAPPSGTNNVVLNWYAEM